MRCVLCRHGETRPGVVTVPLTRADTTVVIKGVPAEVCENCGEYYLTEEVTNCLLRDADKAVQSGAEVEIRRYAA